MCELPPLPSTDGFFPSRHLIIYLLSGLILGPAWTTWTTLGKLRPHIPKIDPSPFTKSVSIIGHGYVSYSACAADVIIAKRVGQVLDFFVVKTHIISDDEVISRFCSALDRIMVLEEEVEVARMRGS